jgi:uncharacterized protein (TIGR03084 family)
VPEPAALLAGLLDDLAAEGAVLDAVVAELEDTAWLTPTPAEGWTVAMQIAHLAWTDEQALVAVTDPAAFTAAVPGRGAELADVVDTAAAHGAAADPEVLVERWRAGRAELAREVAALPDGSKVPWFGPPMSAPSLATARLMETWAHSY